MPPGVTGERPPVTGVQLDELLELVLSHHDVCSREPLYRRYDAVVRGRTVIPRGAADAGVLAPDSRIAARHGVGGRGESALGGSILGLPPNMRCYEAIRCVVAVGRPCRSASPTV